LQNCAIAQARSPGDFRLIVEAMVRLRSRSCTAPSPHSRVPRITARQRRGRLRRAKCLEVLNTSGANVTAPAFTALRDALDHWGRGAAPPISVHDCARVVRLIDQAYERAG
jgi:hypothetical protein